MGVRKAALKNRFAACVMVLALVLLVLISASCLIAEADHDCTGEDCPVCACLLRFENVLRRLGAGADARTAILQLSVRFAVLLLLLTSGVFKPSTPVLRKVRLND